MVEEMSSQVLASFGELFSMHSKLSKLCDEAVGCSAPTDPRAPHKALLMSNGLHAGSGSAHVALFAGSGPWSLEAQDK